MNSNNVLLCGASGMIGGHILELCLDDPNVKKITSLVRRPTGINDPKMNEVVIKNFSIYDARAKYLSNIDIVFFCIGVYTGNVNRDQFRKITIDYPYELAKVLIEKNSNLKFCLLSGAGADRKEKSKMIFAKDKGIIENKLIKIMNDNFYSFRPAYIYPVNPRIEPNFSYKISRILYPLIRLLGSKYSIPSKQLAKAMLKVGKYGYKESIIENENCVELGK